MAGRTGGLIFDEDEEVLLRIVDYFFFKYFVIHAHMYKYVLFV